VKTQRKVEVIFKNIFDLAREGTKDKAQQSALRKAVKCKLAT